MRLADDEIRDVLARAEEIERFAPGDAMQAEMEAVIEAAEEVGISRAAVERALRERFDLRPVSTTVGDLVFARSANGNYYPAEVVSVAQHALEVRFLSGGEDIVPLDELQPCSFRPGAQVAVNWPWWGACTCTVFRYDATKRRVTVDDGWGSTRTFPVGEVWLDALPKSGSRNRSRARIHAALIGAGVVLGAILGSVVTAAILR